MVDDCNKKRMVACAYIEPTMPDIKTPAAMSMTQPILRETITIHTGENALGKVTVYKDELEEQIRKNLKLNICGFK